MALTALGHLVIGKTGGLTKQQKQMGDEFSRVISECLHAAAHGPFFKLAGSETGGGRPKHGGQQRTGEFDWLPH